jgi:hypothetical protein
MTLSCGKDYATVKRDALPRIAEGVEAQHEGCASEFRRRLLRRCCRSKPAAFAVRALRAISTHQLAVLNRSTSSGFEFPKSYILLGGSRGAGRHQSRLRSTCCQLGNLRQYRFQVGGGIWS